MMESQWHHIKTLLLIGTKMPFWSLLYSSLAAWQTDHTILGDLNCDGLKKTGTEYKALEKFCTDMNLKQLITKPTRITATTESLLDVILVS